MGAPRSLVFPNGKQPSSLSPMPSPSSPARDRAEALTLQAVFEAEEVPLLCYAFSFVGRRAIAEEIVQDVFLHLHRHWDEVRNPTAWLYQSVRNRSRNHFRDHKREILTDNEREPADSEGDTPDDLLERMEAAGVLRMLLAEMDETDRQLVHLKYFEGLKYREISDQTGLSIGNVGYRLHHILDRLADKLRQQGIDGTIA